MAGRQSTPETTNPVSDQCELNEVPVHLEPSARGSRGSSARKGDPARASTWTYHFFWGLEDVIAVFTQPVELGADQQGGRRALPERRRRQRLGRSSSAASRRRWPRTATSSSIRAASRTSTDDFSAPDRRLQEGQRRDRHRRGDPAGYQDLLDPGAPAGLPAQGRDRGQGAALPRRRSRPSASSATACRPRCGGRRAIPSSPRSPAQTAAQLADAYEGATKASSGPSRIGFVHALFEVAIDTLKRAKDLGTTAADPRRARRHRPRHHRAVPVGLGQGTGQERDAGRRSVGRPVGARQKYKYELVVVDNRTAPERADRRQAEAARLIGRSRRDGRLSPMTEVLALERSLQVVRRRSAPIGRRLAAGERARGAAASSAPTAPARPRVFNLISGDVRAGRRVPFASGRGHHAARRRTSAAGAASAAPIRSRIPSAA